MSSASSLGEEPSGSLRFATYARWGRPRGYQGDGRIAAAMAEAAMLNTGECRSP